MKEKTVFKKIIDGELPAYKVYEDGNLIAILDKFPVNLGHTLIIPKGDFTNLYDTPDEILCEMIILSKKIALILKEKIKADGINIAMNNESAAGQVISNPHIYIIPRFKNDGFRHWKGKIIPNEEENKEIAEKIKFELN